MDLRARGHGAALTPQEFASLCKAASKCTYLNLSGAYQISSLAPLYGVTGQGNTSLLLTRLTLDDTTVTDDELSSLLPCLPFLTCLSLRGCSFLRGDFLTHSSTTSTPPLTSLNLADCTLALHLNPNIAKSIASLFPNLSTLDLGGNTACDATVTALASLSRLVALGLRDTHGVTELGLEDLASGPAGQSLRVLDAEGCIGIGDGCWAALSRLPHLHRLTLARIPHLLQTGPLPDHAAAAMWRWRRLRHLSLAGSNPHPATLKVLAATCGPGLVFLDISAPGGGGASSLPRPHLARLTPHQLRDLTESVKSLKKLRVFIAARTGLPLEAAVAFMRASPRMHHLDLSGCSLGPRSGLGGGLNRGPAAAGRLWSSGIFMPGAAPYRAEAADVSTSLTAPGPDEFALALGAMSELRVLKMNDCGSGITARHLCYMHWLKKLEVVSVGGNRGIGDVVAAELRPSVGCLTYVDLSGTGVSDVGINRLFVVPTADSRSISGSTVLPLKVLKLARSNVTVQGIERILQCLRPAGSTASPPSNLTTLDLSDCPALVSGNASTRVVDLLTSTSTRLSSLSLRGCHRLDPSGVSLLHRLPSLTSLDLARCGESVTDDSVHMLCRHLTRLTRLRVDGAHALTTQALTSMATLPMLVELDVTCCSGLGEDDAVKNELPLGLMNSCIHLPQGGMHAFGSRRGRGTGGADLFGGDLSLSSLLFAEEQEQEQDE